MDKFHNKKRIKYKPKNKIELKKLIEKENVYLGDIDTSLITDMSFLFYEKKITNLNGLEEWDVKNVKNMGGMFHSCENLTNINGLRKWNVKNLINMESMFFGCKNLKTLDGLENWNISNVINMSYTFSGCKKLGNINLLKNWDFSKVGNMFCTFNKCKQLRDKKNILIGLNLSNVFRAENCFYNTRIVIDFRKLKFKDKCMIKGLYSHNVFEVDFHQFSTFFKLKKYCSKPKKQKYINNILLKRYSRNDNIKVIK